MIQVLSSMTVSLRFENSLNSDLDQLCTNLIPFPRIHFPTSHHAPVHCQTRIEHETIDEIELTRAVFTPSSQFVKVDISVGKLMACVLQYRGLINPKDVNEAIFEIKRRNDIHFVDWCPTGFKVGINSFPPTTVPSSALAQTSRSVTMLCNTTAICQMWRKLDSKFDMLFSKRSFVHWYVGEGMEEGEFNEGRDNISSIIKDYEEVALTEDEFIKGTDGTLKQQHHEDDVERTHNPDSKIFPGDIEKQNMSNDGYKSD